MALSRQLELSVEPLPPDGWVRIQRAETLGRDLFQLSRLAVPPQAFSVQLRDPTGRIHWEPDGIELPAAGRVFGELLKQLYRGNCRRMNLAVSVAHVLHHVLRLVGECDERWQEGLREYMAGHRATHAFELSVRNPDDPRDPYVMDYWWCPKPSLGPILANSWSHRMSGYLAPWPDHGALAVAFGPGSPVRMLARILSVCRLAFQGAGVGEAVVILSHQLTLQEVRAAAQRPSVEQAMLALDRKALLAEWEEYQHEVEGRVYTARQKRRPGARRSDAERRSSATSF